MKRMHTNQQIEEIAEEAVEAATLYQHNIALYGSVEDTSFSVFLRFITKRRAPYTLEEFQQRLVARFPCNPSNPKDFPMMIPANGLAYDSDLEVTSSIFGVSGAANPKRIILRINTPTDPIPYYKWVIATLETDAITFKDYSIEFFQ